MIMNNTLIILSKILIIRNLLQLYRKVYKKQNIIIDLVHPNQF